MFAIKTGQGYVYAIGLSEDDRVDERGKEIVEIVTYRDDLDEAHLFRGDEWVLEGSDLFDFIYEEDSSPISYVYVVDGEIVDEVLRVG